MRVQILIIDFQQLSSQTGVLFVSCSNGAMGTVAFAGSLKVPRHWDSAQTLAANPTKPASTREVIHLVFRVFDILSPKVVFSGGEWSTDSW